MVLWHQRSSVNGDAAAGLRHDVEGTCALSAPPAATAPWMIDHTCAPAEGIATAVVHVRVEPAAAVPAAKAQLAMNKPIQATPPVAIVFALEMMSAKLK